MVILFAVKMPHIKEELCFYKGNFDRISFAVQAPPVFPLSQRVKIPGYLARARARARPAPL